MTLFAQWSNRVCYISFCEINDLLESFSLTNVKFALSCQFLDLVWVLTECSVKSLQRLTHNTQSMALFSSRFFFLLQYILSLFGHYWINTSFLFIFSPVILEKWWRFYRRLFCSDFSRDIWFTSLLMLQAQGTMTANSKRVFTAAIS